MKIEEREVPSVLVRSKLPGTDYVVNPYTGCELAKLRRTGRAPSLLLSSVTDPYQAVEKKYRLTRGVLEVLAREPYPGEVGMLSEAGVRSAFVEHINLRPYIRRRLWARLKTESAEVQQVYRDASTAEHRAALDVVIAELLREHGLTLRLSKVLYHQEA